MTNPTGETHDMNWRRFLSLLYQERPCEICHAKTWCIHREPLVDLAERQAWVEK
jgi:hypothetical protein